MSEIKNKDSSTPPFDPFDMNNYRVEKLKKADKIGFERWMEIFGGPMAIISFLLIYYWAVISFLNEINVDSLKEDSLKRYNEVGAASFSRINYAMPCNFCCFYHFMDNGECAQLLDNTIGDHYYGTHRSYYRKSRLCSIGSSGHVAQYFILCACKYVSINESCQTICTMVCK